MAVKLDQRDRPQHSDLASCLVCREPAILRSHAGQALSLDLCCGLGQRAPGPGRHAQ
jgi:hypothetical protein